MNRLSIAEIKHILISAKLPITHRLGERLLDVMRENERLRSDLAKIGNIAIANNKRDDFQSIYDIVLKSQPTKSADADS